jgi:DNA (cytosine-5)-methyltransferase 1
MTTPTHGSLCTGYGGLELALAGTGALKWVAEIDADASRVLADRFPGTPNLGDLKTADPEPVDVITAGFPCQPLSTAGRRKGMDDDRWIWDDIEALVGRMEPRPGLLLLENVPGLLTANGGDAMARVVHGLAGLGYVGTWRTLRAADVGACHGRRRVFIAAAHAERLRERPERGDGRGDEGGGHRPGRPPLPAQPEVAHPTDTETDDRGARLLPTPAAWDGSRGPDYARQRERAATGSGGDDLTTAVAKLLPTPQARDEKEWTDSRATPDTIGRARGAGGAGSLVDLPKLLPTPTSVMGSGGNTSRSGDRSDELLLGGLLRQVGRNLPTPTAADAKMARNETAWRADGTTGTGRTMSDVAHAEMWGDYVDAINRHMNATGQEAPDPVDEGRRLNPAFVEWMMMLPPGWVTDIPGLTRGAQLRILGNGVVPAQATTAYAELLTRLQRPHHSP